MNVTLPLGETRQYHSNSQIARVITEAWVSENLYCPRCGYEKIEKFPNNRPAADFFCPRCGCQYELKSKKGKWGAKVNDGAYHTMIQRISSNENPDFFFMNYRENEVQNFFIIPKYFFVPDVIEKRKPLAETARRAGWVGCNILLGKIPEQGKIYLLKNGVPVERECVVAQVQKRAGLETRNLTARGWLLDILNIINGISEREFSLEQVYAFEERLAEKHPQNHHIKPKIRQQLQVLRDKGVVEFLGDGMYRKVW